MTVFSSYEPVPQGSPAYRSEAALGSGSSTLTTQSITLSDREWKSFLIKLVYCARGNVCEGG